MMALDLYLDNLCLDNNMNTVVNSKDIKIYKR